LAVSLRDAIELIEPKVEAADKSPYGAVARTGRHKGRCDLGDLREAPHPSLALDAQDGSAPNGFRSALRQRQRRGGKNDTLCGHIDFGSAGNARAHRFGARLQDHCRIDSIAFGMLCKGLFQCLGKGLALLFFPYPRARRPHIDIALWPAVAVGMVIIHHALAQRVIGHILLRGDQRRVNRDALGIGLVLESLDSELASHLHSVVGSQRGWALAFRTHAQSQIDGLGHGFVILLL
jgi:hypothetical protein